MALRCCRVSVTDLEGTTHSVSVKASTLFEAAAEAISTFRQEQWAVRALTENAILRIEVQVPPVIHDVPLKAVERWRNGPSASPKEYSAKKRLRDT